MNGDNAIAIHNNQILANNTTTRDINGRISNTAKQVLTKVIINFCHIHLSFTLR
jgi:hypothetical protein